MAIQFLNQLQFNQNEALQLRLENLGTLPTSGNVIGQLAYKTGTNPGVYEATGTGNNWELLSTTAGDITGVNASTTENLLGIDVASATGPIPVVGLDIAGRTAIGAAPATDDELLILDVSGTPTNKKVTVANLISLAPQGDITGVTAGTYLSGGGTTGTVTLNHDSTTRSDGATSASPAFGGSFTAVSAVSTNATGHVDGITVKTVNIPANPNTDTTYTLPVTAGATNTAVLELTKGGSGSGVASTVTIAGVDKLTKITETAQNNGTVTVGLADGSYAAWGSAGSNIQLPDGATAKTQTTGDNTDKIATTAFVQASLTGLLEFKGGFNATSGAIVGGGNLTAQNNGTVTVGLADGSYAAWGSAGSNIQLPDGATAKTQTTGDNTDKIATTAFVQASLTGLLEFKGGFNATSGAIVGGGNLTANAGRVAVAVGDYYVVTVDGNFFGNANTPLTVGDSVICQTAAAADQSVEADFIIVQSETDLATLTTVGLGNVNASATSGIDVSYNAGTANLVLDVNELTADTGLPTAIAGTDGSGNTRKFTYANVFQAKGKKISLDATDAGVASSFGGGITTWVITLSDAWMSGVVGTNCMVELTKDSDGSTAYAEITRGATTITIKMTSASLVANNLYSVLLNNVA